MVFPRSSPMERPRWALKKMLHSQFVRYLISNIPGWLILARIISNNSFLLLTGRKSILYRSSNTSPSGERIIRLIETLLNSSVKSGLLFRASQLTIIFGKDLLSSIFKRVKKITLDQAISILI